MAEAIELWEERSNRLARHGLDYDIAEMFKKVALEKIWVGKVWGCVEFLEVERLGFDKWLRKVKEHARAKKMDKDAAKGHTGVALGVANAFQEEWSWSSWAEEEAWDRVNAVTFGKGKKQKGSKGKSNGRGPR